MSRLWRRRGILAGTAVILAILAAAVVALVSRGGPDAASVRLEPRNGVGTLRVGGELDAGIAVPLLEALWEQLDHRGARLLRPLGRHGDRHAMQRAQRNAERILSKRPPSDR